MDITIKKLKKARTSLQTELKDVPQGSVFAITYEYQPDGDWPSYRTDVYMLLKRNHDSLGYEALEGHLLKAKEWEPAYALCVNLRTGALKGISVNEIVDIINNPTIISED